MTHAILRSRIRKYLVRSVSAFSVLLLAALTADTAVAKGKIFKAVYAGTVTSTEIDINADEEETARVSQGAGQGTIIGRFVWHEVRESDNLEPDHPDNFCHFPAIEHIEVHWTMVMTDEAGASQLFFRLSEDQPTTICIDPNNPPTGGDSHSHDLDIIGGTSRFANASGRVTIICSGRQLAAGLVAAGPAHGAVSCEMSGLIDF